MQKKTSQRVLSVVVGLAVGMAGGVSMGEGTIRSQAAYALWKRLYVKFGEGAADQLARQAISRGAPHEEYALNTMLSYYSDSVQIVLRGQAQPLRFRKMWLDPRTEQPYYETAEGGVVKDRYPFYFVPHHRNYSCRSTGDNGNSYSYTIRADADYWIRETVVKSTFGAELLFHPVQYQFGLELIAANCQDTRDPYLLPEEGWGTVPRGQWITRSPYFENCDVHYFLAWYDTAK